MTTMNFKSIATAALLALGLTGVSLSAQAQDLGVVLGYRVDNADTVAPSEYKQKSSIQGGLVAKLELSGPLWLRTGLLYTQRDLDLQTGGVSQGDLKLSYFEVPAGLLYKFSDYGGVFAGAALDLNLSKDCPGGSCTAADVNAAPIALQLGGSFKVAPQFGFEVIYESVMGNLAKDVKNGRGIMVNAMLTFD